MYIITCTMVAIILGGMSCTWLSNAIWWLLKKLPKYELVYSTYPELFTPAIKTTCLAIPFVTIFKIIDYFLLIFRDEDLPKSIAGFTGLTLSKSNNKDTGLFVLYKALLFQ